MEKNIRKILVPVDNSTHAGRAAAFAATLAAALGATVTFLHVIDNDAVTLLGVDALSKPDLDKAVNKFSTLAFQAAEDATAASGVKADTDIRLGKPSYEIVRYARENGTDLIVMGSRGLSKMREILVGSVSSQVVHHAPCSVTVVR